MFCLIKNICLFTSCATVVIQKPWFDSSSHGQLKMENQKDKGRSTICLGKMLGVLKRFHFLRWGKFCDHSSHCPAALWLDAKSCHILRHKQFILCRHTYPSKLCLPGSRKWRWWFYLRLHKPDNLQWKMHVHEWCLLFWLRSLCLQLFLQVSQKSISSSELWAVPMIE